MGRLVSVDNKELTETLTPLNATLTKKPRGWGGAVMVNQKPLWSAGGLTPTLSAFAAAFLPAATRSA
jgi:hypothetical protein